MKGKGYQLFNENLASSQVSVIKILKDSNPKTSQKALFYKPFWGLTGETFYCLTNMG